MPENEHKVVTKWKEADAQALEDRVSAIDETLEHLNDLVEMFDDDHDVVTELRTMTGRLRERKNHFHDKAEKIRAELAS